MDNTTLRDGFVGQKMIVLPKMIKKALRTNRITQQFYITDIGYYPKAKNHYRQRKDGTDEYIFIYCIEGEGWIKLNGKRFTILPNSFFIVPKGVKHSYASNNENPWTIYWAHFNGIAAESLFERYCSIPQPIQAIPFDSSRIQLFNQIYRILEKSYAEPQLEYANMLGLNFVASYVYKEIDEVAKKGEKGDLVDSIIAYLNQNLDQSFRSEDIAKRFKCSPSYIFTLFKKRTGYSIIHYFNLKKIQKACEFLKYTDLSVKEISHKTGFKDPLYFSRMFKKHMGMPPKAYKKIHRR